MEDAEAEKREARAAIEAEGDELAVEQQPVRQTGELGQPLGHIPAAPAPHHEPLLGRDERPEPIPFHLEGVVAERQAVGAGEHGLGEHGATVSRGASA